ncbi:hypothetical protein CANINC_000916 [Pichia inconspicua]|uniref:F-box domain-containing protein n=1 Tax=Pichia inconspicua TaxID=52247 RepID=A0A4T0X524_9ASCO|nr:hypothetical protein CANINC_000916 [[Candida] inconspicua]
MKRSLEGEYCDNRKLQKCGEFSLLSELPFEILELVLNEVEVEDLKNVSILNRKIRNRVLNRLFREVKVKWEEIKELSEWKQNYFIEKVRILREEGTRSSSEWNISIKPLFLCNNLKDLEIELIGSSRCLKYKDDFKSDESFKIENIKLVCFNGGNGDYSEKALFESTHIKRFKGLKSIELNGFTLSKDMYEEEDEEVEEEEEGKKSKRLGKLKEITLVNCVWEYPFGISDIFSGCKAEIVRIEYWGEAMRFTSSERFKAMVNIGANRRWQSDRKWWSSVRVVVVAVDEGYSGTMRPGRALATAFTKGDLPHLEEVRLVGWR